MKTIIKYLITGVLLTSLGACDRDADFEKELYEKLIYIVSDDNQLFSMMYSFADESPSATMSVACSGTNQIEQDVLVTLERDDVLLAKYNKSNFDIYTEKYAKELKPSQFSMPSMSLFLKKGASNSYNTLDVNISTEELEKLSPDSIYFVALSIKNVSGYDINEKKKNVLCRVYYKNVYAETQNPTYYSMKGSQTKAGATSVISGSKLIHPLTKEEVRVFVGNENYEANLNSINKLGMTIKVNPDNTIQLTPYNEEEEMIEIEQLEPLDDPTFMYKNIYNTTEKRFYLHYQYRTKNDGAWGDWIVIKQALKLLEPELGK